MQQNKKILSMDYISGFVDGEGHVSDKNHVQRFDIANNNKDLLDQINKSIKYHCGFTLGIGIVKHKNKNYRDTYYLITNKLSHLYILSEMLDLKQPDKIENINYWAEEFKIRYNRVKLAKYLLKDKRLSKKVIAKHVGVSYQTIYRWIKQDFKLSYLKI